MIYHRHRVGDHGVKEYRIGEPSHSLDDLDGCVRDSAKTLRRHADEFDTIVAQGMSGVVVAAPLACILHKELAIVRKPDEHSHQGNGGDVIGERAISDGRRCLFVDDFIGGGDTRQRVLDTVKGYGGIFAATYLYNHDSYAAH